MVKRKDSEEKKIPGLNFNYPIIVNFSISETQEIIDKFAIMCANQSVSKSAQLRRFFYEILGIKNDEEFNIIQEETRRFEKDRIKNLIRNKYGYTKISKLMSEKIRGYIKKNENK